MSEHIEISSADSVLRIAFNRPDKRNALTNAMYTALAEALNTADNDGGVRAILLHGTDQCFTAGNDLKDFAADPPTGEDSPVYRFLAAISTARKPIIAAVAGPAVGIGTTTLLHCDLVYAAPNTRFQLPFTDLGLCPEAASSFLLPRLVGHQRASELLLLGEPFSADEAYRLGLINGVVESGHVVDEALAVAQKVASKPAASIRLTKALLRASVDTKVQSTMSTESGYFVERLTSPEAKEAFAAFAEKRKPDFSAFS